MTQFDRINALTTTCRNTWFFMLALLAFVGVTLIGFEHIDFYGANRSTVLPIINVEIPTRFFFFAAPAIVSSVFCYFHFYLIRLWDALSVVDHSCDGKPTGDLIAPWLVSDAFLHRRCKLREDGCATPRAFEGLSLVLNVVLAWAFGLLVLGALWWLSATARDLWMTSVAGLAFALSAVVSGSSLALAELRAREETDPSTKILSTLPALGALGVGVFLIPVLSLQRTIGNGEQLAPVFLVGEKVIERPENWVPYSAARKFYQIDWCQQNLQVDCKLNERNQSNFEVDWIAFRANSLANMARPRWSKPNSDRKLHLKGANLTGTFMVGARLKGAQLQDANLTEANLEQANFEGANLQSAQLSRATLVNANFKDANLSDARLIDTKLQNSEFRDAELENAVLLGANLKKSVLRGIKSKKATYQNAILSNADLSGAQLDHVKFLDTQLDGALLIGTNLQNAQLWNTIMTGSNLKGAIANQADFKGADLRFANLEGVSFKDAYLASTNLGHANMSGSLLMSSHPQFPQRLKLTNFKGSINDAGAIRRVDLSEARWDEQTDFRNALVDLRSVVLPIGFFERMGQPCQWITEETTDEQFLKVWKWWLAKNSQPSFGLEVDIASSRLLTKLGLSDCEPNQPYGAMPSHRINILPYLD